MNNEVLIEQVKKEMEDQKERERKASIRTMLRLIDSKKEELERVELKLKKLEESLEKGDYSAVSNSVWCTYDTLVIPYHNGSTWTFIS